MLKGKNEIGWTKKIPGQRPVRDKEHGLLGQEIWNILKSYGFVHRGSHFQKEKNDPLTEWEKKLKSWLIWGYWETENPAVVQANQWLHSYVNEIKKKRLENNKSKDTKE